MKINFSHKVLSSWIFKTKERLVNLYFLVAVSHLQYRISLVESFPLLLCVCVCVCGLVFSEENSYENFVNPCQNNMASYPIRHIQLRTQNACRYTDSLDGEVGRSCRSGSLRLSSWTLLLLCAPCRVVCGFSWPSLFTDALCSCVCVCVCVWGGGIHPLCYTQSIVL